MPWTVGIVVFLLVVVPVVLFSAGSDLFGSDPGVIDSYNRDTIESCELPASSTLVQVSVEHLVDGDGQRYRSMSYVYASPALTADLAAFFGVTPGRSMPVSPERACRFEQRPLVMLVPAAGSDTGGDDVWAEADADVRMRADVPAGTRSFFRLRLAQAEEDGIF